MTPFVAQRARLFVSELSSGVAAGGNNILTFQLC